MSFRLGPGFPVTQMEPIYGGLARRAQATLGVTSFGMQLFTLPPDWEGCPNHDHGEMRSTLTRRRSTSRSRGRRGSWRTARSST
jgi:hypothetical protein